MIKLRNVTKSYGGVPLFQNFSAEFPEHQVSCILGGSGVGKTTLINLLAGLALPDSGEVLLPAGHVISYVFQEHRLLPWLSVSENIAFVLRKMPKAQSDGLVEKYLKLVGLSQYAAAPISDLSGGMIQRVALCRAFAYPSTLLFLDEPFKGLDPRMKDELLAAFEAIYEADDRTVFFVTHDIDEATRLADTIYVLKNRPAEIAGRFDSADFDDRLPGRIMELL